MTTSFPFTVYRSLFTLRLLFTIYHIKQKTDHREHIENGKLKIVNEAGGV